jgi:hypothetical protein
MVTIINYDKIKHTQINCMGKLWLMAAIEERDDYYQFSFVPDINGVFALHKAQFIRLYREIDEIGVGYDIEFLNLNRLRKRIHNQYLKDPKDLLNWISSKFLVYVED